MSIIPSGTISCESKRLTQSVLLMGELGGRESGERGVGIASRCCSGEM